METVESILSANGSCPVPSVPTLRHGRSQPAAHCGHCRTRVTPAEWTICTVVTLCFLADLLGSSLFIDAQELSKSSADDEIRRRLASDETVLSCEKKVVQLSSNEPEGSVEVSDSTVLCSCAHVRPVFLLLLHFQLEPFLWVYVYCKYDATIIFRLLDGSSHNRTHARF